MKKIFLTIVLASMFSVVVFCTTGVGAAVPASTEGGFASSPVNYEKALLEGVYRCYQYGYFKTPIDYYNYSGFGSIVNPGADANGIVTTGKTIALPNSMNQLKDSNVSCDEFFTGFNATGKSNRFSGLNSLLKVSEYKIAIPDNNSSLTEIRNYISGLGYTASTNSSSDEVEGRCLKVQYLYTNDVGSGAAYNPSFCAVVNNSNNEVVRFEARQASTPLGFSVENDGTSMILLIETGINNQTGGPAMGQRGRFVLNSDNTIEYQRFVHYNGKIVNTVSEGKTNGKTWGDLIELYVKVLVGGEGGIGDGFRQIKVSIPYSANYFSYDLDLSYGCDGQRYCVEKESSPNISGEVEITNWDLAAEKAFSYFTSNTYNKYSDIVYDLDEKIGLYNDYFTKYYRMIIDPNVDNTDLADIDGDAISDTLSGAQFKKIKILVHTNLSLEEGQYANLTEAQKKQVNGLNSYREYYIPIEPLENKGETVYRIKEDGHFCIDGTDNNCMLTFIELIDEYNRAVEKLVEQRSLIYEKACYRFAKDLVTDRYVNDLAKLQNMKSYATDFINEIDSMLSGYRNGVLTFPDEYYGRFDEYYLYGYYEYNPTQAQILNLYKSDLTNLYKAMNSGYNGQPVFKNVDVNDGQYIVAKLYNAAITMLDATETENGSIVKPSDEMFNSVETLEAEFKKEVDDFDFYLRGLEATFNATYDRIEKGEQGDQAAYISAYNSDTGIVECLAGDPNNYAYILKNIEDELLRRFDSIRPVGVEWTDPFAGYDAAANGKEPVSTGNKMCYENSGAMGWLLCPAIEAITKFGGVIWNDVEQNHMKVPTSEIFKEGGGVRKAWNSIRDIANIVFVILFLVVIFSQLTGVGIDNYGIKKILPKLILIAILVNLSWIICELAVDLSNILGVGVNTMLTDFASEVAPRISISGGNISVTSWISEIVFAGGGVALMIMLAAPLAISMALAVLGIIGSIVVAILVLYFVLIIREVGIVLTIVLAPVAIVCYALPNTEKLSKKWFGLFKALLVVYPICGLVMGGGKLAGAVLANIGVSSGSTAMNVAAMIAQVVPFFLIPMLLKNSLALLGNIGARLSQAGKGLSRKGSGALRSGVQNSKAYKDWAKYQQGKVANRRDRRIIDKYKGRKGLSERERSKYSEALRRQSAYEASIDTNQGEAAWKNARERRYAESYARLADRNAVEKTFSDSLGGADSEAAGAAFDELLNRGGIDKAMNHLYNNDWDKMDKTVKERLIQKMGASNVDVFRAFNKYRGAGGVGSFKDWYDGTNTDKNIMEKEGKTKFASYGNHLMNKGMNAMVGIDKDELKFMANHVPNVMDGDLESYYTRFAQAMLKSNDAEAQTVAQQVVTQGIRSGVNLNQMGFTAGTLGMMRADDARALEEAFKDKGGIEEIQRQLRSQIEDIKKDPRVRSGMNEEVKRILGLSGSLDIREQILKK